VVHWSDGEVQDLGPLPVDRSHTIRRQAGEAG
jgi:hypothetical protein